jgi:hypothetical protein
MIEKAIFANLLSNEQFTRKAIPFIKAEYFQSRSDQVLFNIISSFVERFNNLPTKAALTVEIDDYVGLNDEETNQLVEYVASLDQHGDVDPEWLLEQTEKFCQDRAVYNAIMKSIQIFDGKANLDKGAIPQLLADALAVSFDTTIGHDFLGNAEMRYEFYHRKEQRIPFDLTYFNKITKGGLPRKTLNVALAGCVHPDTKIRVRLRK